MTGVERRGAHSVCPVCRKRVPSRHILQDNRVYLSRVCSRHGEQSSVIWKTRAAMPLWRGIVPAIHSGKTPDGFLEPARGYGFTVTVTARAFQDARNIDPERLRQCSLRLCRDGKFLPFCSCSLGAS